MTTQAANFGELKCEIEIQAAPAKVWQALTENIGQWWPADFYAGGEAGERSYHLEARPGGRMYESWNAGGGVLWGTVVVVDPEKSLQVVGYETPDWGGPRQWFGSWLLTEKAGGTLVTFSESAIGKVTDTSVESKTKGWNFLWAVMKAHIEGAPAPGWED